MPVAGEFYLVRYQTYGPVIYHERLCTGVSADGATACVLTPDDDHYLEECTPASADIHAVVPQPGQGAVMAHIPAVQCYRFTDLPSDDILAGYFASAAVLLGIAWPMPPFLVQLGVNNVGGRPAGVWTIGDGLPAAPVLPIAAAVAPAGPAAGGAAGGVAALAAALAGGAVPVPPAGAGGAGAVVGGEAAPAAVPADRRVLPWIGAAGAAHPLDFRVSMLQQWETPILGWSIRGPRTTAWCLAHMAEHGGSPTGWHQRWLVNHRLQAHEYGVDWHEACCQILQAMCCADQLQSPNLEAAELVCRQVQLLEERHREKKGADESLDLHLYMGTTSASRGGVCVCPSLQDFISEELRKEAAVLKERRKAREERELQKGDRTKKKKGKGKGEGDE